MTTSTQWIKQLSEDKMFPLTIEGLEKAMVFEQVRTSDPDEKG